MDILCVSQLKRCECSRNSEKLRACKTIFCRYFFFVLFAAQNGTVSAVTVVINTKLPAVVKLRAGNMQLRLSAARARVLNYHS